MVGENLQQMETVIHAQQQKAAQAQSLRNQQLVLDAEKEKINRANSVASEPRTGQVAIRHPIYGTTVVGKRTYL
jgi:hypothetical protein